MTDVWSWGMFVIEVLLKGKNLFDYIEGKDQDQIADEILTYVNYSYSSIDPNLSLSLSLFPLLVMDSAIRFLPTVQRI